jgi:hypothetical protein
LCKEVKSFGIGTSIRGDPFEFPILNKLQGLSVITGPPQASSEPELKVGEGVQLDIGEEVTTASIDPAGNEHVDHFIDGLLGKTRYDY